MGVNDLRAVSRSRKDEIDQHMAEFGLCIIKVDSKNLLFQVTCPLAPEGLTLVVHQSRESCALGWVSVPCQSTLVWSISRPLVVEYETLLSSCRSFPSVLLARLSIEAPARITH